MLHHLKTKGNIVASAYQTKYSPLGRRMWEIQASAGNRGWKVRALRMVLFSIKEAWVH